MQRITNRVLDKFPLRPPVKLTEGKGNNYVTNIKRVYYIFYFSEIQNLWNIRLPTKDCVQNIRTIKRDKKKKTIIQKFCRKNFSRVIYITQANFISFFSFLISFFTVLDAISPDSRILNLRSFKLHKMKQKKLCGDTLATLSTHVLNKFLKSSWKLWFLGTNAFARAFLHTFIALLWYNIPFSLVFRKLSLDGSLVATM